jgi:hypothetical protein
MLDAGPRRSEYPVNPYCFIALDYASVCALGAKKRKSSRACRLTQGKSMMISAVSTTGAKKGMFDDGRGLA